MSTESKDAVFARAEQLLKDGGFNITAKDANRPWGGFFVIDEADAQAYADKYFSGISVDSLKIGGKLSPKLLIVAPHVRLSWQYHHRRAEIWQVIEGPVGVVTSYTNDEGPQLVLNNGQQIKLQKEERHRLVGLDNWGLVAEIWQHTEKDEPSDEDDIVRVQDDFGR